MTNLERLLRKEQAYYYGDEILQTFDFSNFCEVNEPILIVFKYESDNGFLEIDSDWFSKLQVESDIIKFSCTKSILELLIEKEPAYWDHKRIFNTTDYSNKIGSKVCIQINYFDKKDCISTIWISKEEINRAFAKNILTFDVDISKKMK